MPVCIFNTLARSSCQPQLNQLLQQITPLYTGPCCFSCCPCCRLQPLRPPTPALTHSCPSPLPLSTTILPPSCHPLCHCRRRPFRLRHRLAAAITVSHCNHAAGRPRPLPHTRCHSCSRMHAAAAARCRTHAASAARCRMNAGCLPSIAIIPPAAAACCRTHAR